MDLPQLEAMTSYWRKFPPVHIQVSRIAASLGVTPAESNERTTPESNEEQAESLMQNFPLAPAQPYRTAEEYLRTRSQVRSQPE